MQFPRIIGGGEGNGGAPSYPLAPVGIRSLGSSDGVSTILTWKGAVSMASPEVSPHCKQAV